MRGPNYDSVHDDDDAIPLAYSVAVEYKLRFAGLGKRGIFPTVSHHGTDKRDLSGFEVQAEQSITHRLSKRRPAVTLEHRSTPIPCFMETTPSWAGFLHHNDTDVFMTAPYFRTGTVTGFPPSSKITQDLTIPRPGTQRPRVLHVRSFVERRAVWAV
jgi:hypothetical protein